MFINNTHEFGYIGFKSETDKRAFIEGWKCAVSELRRKAQGRYEIIDEIEKAFPTNNRAD